MRSHRVLVATLLVLATIVGFAGTFAIWVNRQALNTDNWTTTSGKLLADAKIRATLSTYLVDQLFSNVDVEGALAQRLPDPVKVLAGPAAGGLHELAGRAVPPLLASSKVQAAWESANRAAHSTLLKIINGGGSVVSTDQGVVKLRLRPLVDQLAASLGLENQVAAARAKLSGSTGDKARALASQQLGVQVPDSAGDLTIMRSDQLGTAQDIAGAAKGLAIVLPAIAIALLALAVWLARGWRRVALRRTGWCLVLIGVLLLLIRRVGGNVVVDNLVRVEANRPAVHHVWDIGTSLLYAGAVALVVYGLIVVAAAWLAGPTRVARSLRQALAPSLREHPVAAYGLTGVVLLLVVLWGPTPAFRRVVPVLIFAALLALGVAALRRQAALEFPDAPKGEAVRKLREWRAAARARRAGGDPPGDDGPATGPDEQRIDQLERLGRLRAQGTLSEEEFAAEKSLVMESR